MALVLEVASDLGPGERQRTSELLH